MKKIIRIIREFFNPPKVNICDCRFGDGVRCKECKVPEHP